MCLAIHEHAALLILWRTVWDAMQTPPGLCNCSDPDDASVARSDEYLRELFKRADLKLLYSAVQKGAQPLQYCHVDEDASAGCTSLHGLHATKSVMLWLQALTKGC